MRSRRPRPRLPLLVGPGADRPAADRRRRRARTSGTTTASATSTSPASWSTSTSATSTRRSSPRSRSRPPGCARSRPAFANDARCEAARLIAEVAPGDLNKVFFTNGGAEANENAIRMARLHTGRHKVLADLPQLPRRHRRRDRADRRPAPLGQRAAAMPGIVHFWGPYPYRSAFHADAPRRRSASGRWQHLRDVDHGRGRRRRSPRSSSRRSSAPTASWSRRPATSPACASSATSTASC